VTLPVSMSARNTSTWRWEKLIQAYPIWMDQAHHAIGCHALAGA
jgi:hypothetical protein